jgi:hypothetical protein
MASEVVARMTAGWSPSLGAEGARQQDAGLGLHRRIVLAVQQRAEGRLGLGQPPRPHERAGPVDQQPVPAGVGRVGQADGPLQQLGGDRRRPAGGLGRRPGQPGDGLPVPRGGAAGQVLGHGHGLGARLSQPPAGLAVQGQPHAGREVLVDGLVDEVVAEAEAVAVVFEDAGPHRLGQHRRQLQDRPAGGRRQVGE